MYNCHHVGYLGNTTTCSISKAAWGTAIQFYVPYKVGNNVLLNSGERVCTDGRIWGPTHHLSLLNLGKKVTEFVPLLHIHT
jgi:hypothetical protein